jgi:hypothetical protein
MGFESDFEDSEEARKTRRFPSDKPEGIRGMSAARFLAVAMCLKALEWPCKLSSKHTDSTGADTSVEFAAT